MGIYGCFVYVDVDVGIDMCIHMYERKIGKVRNSLALILSFFLDSIEDLRTGKKLCFVRLESPNEMPSYILRELKSTHT